MVGPCVHPVGTQCVPCFSKHKDIQPSESQQTTARLEGSTLGEEGGPCLQGLAWAALQAQVPAGLCLEQGPPCL